MSQQQQANMSPPWPGARGAKLPGPRPAARPSLASITKTFLLVTVCGLLFGGALAFLAWNAKRRSGPASTELRAEQPPGGSGSVVTSTGAAGPEADEQPVALARQQPRTPGNRYRVVVETAYFFDEPRQSTPNGRYLRRGDVFYGEDETNGFVRTGFVQPNGAAGTGWLKAQGLSKLSGSTAPTAARNRTSRPPTRAQTQPAPPDDSEYAADDVPRAPARRAVALPAGAQRAVVQAGRSYFYDSPDLAQPRKAHCVQGDKVRLGETRGEAVYVTFTNWENVTTTGWMRRDALR